MPHALGLFAAAPDHIEQQLLAALDMHAVYRQDLRQAAIVLTLTDTTIARLAADPAPTATPEPANQAQPTRPTPPRKPTTSGNAFADLTLAAT